LFGDSGSSAAKKKEAQPKEPQAFTINCKACHLLEDVQVGPSLIEIAKLYPRKHKKEFLQWCVNPGKKRELDYTFHQHRYIDSWK
jgi:cytochrome c551/c552